MLVNYSSQDLVNTASQKEKRALSIANGANGVSILVTEGHTL